MYSYCRNNLSVQQGMADSRKCDMCVCMYIYTQTHMQWNITQSHKKERNLAICENMDEPRGYCASEISHMAISKMLYNFTDK